MKTVHAILAALLARCRDTQATEDPALSLLARLRAQCASRAPLFAPEAERSALLQLLTELQDAHERAAESRHPDSR